MGTGSGCLILLKHVLMVNRIILNITIFGVECRYSCKEYNNIMVIQGWKLRP